MADRTPNFRSIFAQSERLEKAGRGQLELPLLQEKFAAHPESLRPVNEFVRMHFERVLDRHQRVVESTAPSCASAKYIVHVLMPIRVPIARQPAMPWLINSTASAGLPECIRTTPMAHRARATGLGMLCFSARSSARVAKA